MSRPRIRDLFDLAISAERAAEALYRGLEAKFAHHPEVAAFWSRYAEDEDGHARWLERLKASLDAEQLEAPADPVMAESLRRLLDVPIEDRLAEVEDLEDAYQLVNELEHSETNAVFEFLITHFASEQTTPAFLRAQLRDHVTRLMVDFPIQFQTAEARHEIKAQG
jgi:rubrerythrin